jgi:hypothetical protein
MANNIYLQVEFKSGNVFEFSKDEKQGFEEHKNSKGVVTYRKYYKEGIYGIYKGTTIRDTKFGREVSIHLVDSYGNNCFLSLPLFTQKKTIAPYVESFITVLPSMEKEYVYRVFPYSMQREGTEYKNYGVSVMHADMYEKTVRKDYPLERLSYGKWGENEEWIDGDIPKAEWVESVDGGKEQDRRERDRFLYKVLEENASHYEKTSNHVTSSEPPKPFNSQQAPQVPAPQKEAPKPVSKEESKPTPESVNSESAIDEDIELPF